MPLKPLVFVPGLPGSIIQERAGDVELFPLPSLVDMTTDRRNKLSGPDDPEADDGVVAGDPVSNVIPGLKSSFIDFSGSLKLADSLYSLLQGLGYTIDPFGKDFQPVGWDWRRPVDGSRAQAAVAQAITALNQASKQPVVILCHSTGGLVVRSLLEKNPALLNAIDQIIAVSVPWAGTVQPLPYLTGQQGIGLVSAGDTQYVMDRSWAAFDLLPPDPVKTVMKDAEGELDFFTNAQGQASPLVDTAWIPTEPTGFPMHARAARSDKQFGARTRSLAAGLNVVCFAGWGVDTLTGCRMDPAGKLTLVSTDEGDGTIARRSAAWLTGATVRNFLVPVGHYPDSQITREHAALWLNPPIRDFLGELLAGRKRPPYVYAAVDGDDADNLGSQVRVRMVALDAAGQPLPDAYALAFGLQGVDSATHYLINDNGRGVMPLKRENITQDAGGGWYHFEVEIHWQEGGVDKRGPRQGLSVHKLE
jgi:hypothetical protein